MAPHALLVDLDGTLWDSYRWLARRLREAADVDVDDTVTTLRDGGNIVAAARKVGVSPSSLASLVTAADDPVPLYPEAGDTLRQLAVRGVPLGIVTSLSWRIAQPMLASTTVADLFDTAVHPGNCRAYKPSPTPITRALRALDVPATADSAYIGDRPSDAQAAQRAGITFLHATWGATETVELTHGDRALGSWVEVLNV